MPINVNNNESVVASNFTQIDRCRHHTTAMAMEPTHAIDDKGGTSVFVMPNTTIQNKRHATKPISIILPDGKKVTSTHICDVTIPGLPTTLTGHILPEMTMASLLGIWLLCKAGCKVVFNDKTCEVIYNKAIILTGYKDPESNLWTLPILGSGPTTTSDIVCPTQPSDTMTKLATFLYHQTNKKMMSSSCINFYATRQYHHCSRPSMTDSSMGRHTSMHVQYINISC